MMFPLETRANIIDRYVSISPKKNNETTLFALTDTKITQA